MNVVDGLSIRKIARKVGHAQDTVIADIRFEQERRALLLGPRRPLELTSAVAFYEGIISKALKKSRLNDKLMEKILGGFDGKVSDRSLDAALKARERLDRLFVLEPITEHKTRKARAEAALAERDAATKSGDGIGDTITIKRVTLQPEKITVDERGRAITE